LVAHGVRAGQRRNELIARATGARTGGAAGGGAVAGNRDGSDGNAIELYQGWGFQQ